MVGEPFKQAGLIFVDVFRANILSTKKTFKKKRIPNLWGLEKDQFWLQVHGLQAAFPAPLAWAFWFQEPIRELGFMISTAWT